MASEARRRAREAGDVWGPSVWAGLRAGDAGNAEEELGVQQNTSAVYPTGRAALALRARRRTAQLNLLLCLFVEFQSETGPSPPPSPLPG